MLCLRATAAWKWIKVVSGELGRAKMYWVTQMASGRLGKSARNCCARSSCHSGRGEGAWSDVEEVGLLENSDKLLGKAGRFPSFRTARNGGDGIGWIADRRVSSESSNERTHARRDCKEVNKVVRQHRICRFWS